MGMGDTTLFFDVYIHLGYFSYSQVYHHKYSE